MSVQCDPKFWYPSSYERQVATRKKCDICGCKIRGKNHETGKAHIEKVNAK